MYLLLATAALPIEPPSKILRVHLFNAFQRRQLLKWHYAFSSATRIS